MAPMKRAPQAHSETREMGRRPHLKKWEPGAGKGLDAFTDISAPALRDRGFYGVWVLEVLGSGLSTQGSFVHLLPLAFT